MTSNDMVRESVAKCECEYVAVFTHVLFAVMLAGALRRTCHGSCVAVFFFRKYSYAGCESQFYSWSVAASEGTLTEPYYLRPRCKTKVKVLNAGKYQVQVR